MKVTLNCRNPRPVAYMHTKSVATMQAMCTSPSGHAIEQDGSKAMVRKCSAPIRVKCSTLTPSADCPKAQEDGRASRLSQRSGGGTHDENSGVEGAYHEVHCCRQVGCVLGEGRKEVAGNEREQRRLCRLWPPSRWCQVQLGPHQEVLHSGGQLWCQFSSKC